MSEAGKGLSSVSAAGLLVDPVNDCESENGKPPVRSVRIALSRLPVKKMPKPLRTTVRLLPKGRQAKPMRGAKLSLLLFTSDFGSPLSAASPTSPVRPEPASVASRFGTVTALDRITFPRPGT